MTETEIQRLVVRLVGDSSSYKAMVQQAVRETNQINKTIGGATNSINSLNIGLGEVGSSFSRLGGAMLAVQGLIAGFSAAFTSLGIYAAGGFEQTTIAFETMLGGAEVTKRTLASLTDFAAKTPFEMPEIEQAARGLIQFGERGDDLMETLNLLGNAASGTSTPFGMIALIFNQVRGVGKLLTQDFRQLSTRGVLSLQDISKYYGQLQKRVISTAEAQQMLSKGMVSFEDLKGIFRMLSGEGGRFANLMERQSESMLGKISTLKDAFNIFLRGIGEEMLPAAKKGVSGLIAIVSALTNMDGATKKLIGTLLGTVGAIGATAGALVTLKLGIMFGVIPALQAFGTAAVAIFSVSSPLVIGVAAFAATILYLSGSLDEIKGTIEAISRVPVKFKEFSEPKVQGLSDADQKRAMKYHEQRAEILARTVNENRFLSASEREVLRLLNDKIKTMEAESEKVMKAGEEAEDLSEGIKKLEDKYKEMKDTIGMTGVEIEIYRLKLQGLSDSEARRLAGLGESAQKAVEVQKLDEDVKKMTESLQTQLDTFGMSSEQLKLYEMRLRGASDAELEAAEIATEHLKIKKEHQAVLDRGKSLIEQYLTPQEKYAKTVKELNNLLSVLGDSFLPTYNRAMADANKTLEEAQKNSKIDVRFNVSGVEAVAWGSAEVVQAQMLGRSGINVRNKVKTTNDFSMFSDPSGVVAFAQAARSNTVRGPSARELTGTSNFDIATDSAYAAQAAEENDPVASRLDKLIEISQKQLDKTPEFESAGLGAGT